LACVYIFGVLVRLGAKHDPEKWTPVFGKDHAQTKGLSEMALSHFA
jgi:hypothetical protein